MTIDAGPKVFRQTHSVTEVKMLIARSKENLVYCVGRFIIFAI